MKQTNLLLLLCVTFLFFSCKKNQLPSFGSIQQQSVEQASGDYIQRFYGVDKSYKFLVPNPEDASTSIQLTLEWDANGVAKYSTERVERDAAAENAHRVFLPDTEFDKESGSLKPTHAEVKTVTLAFQDGEIVALLTPNGTGTVMCWKCCGSPANWNPMGWWYCLGTPGQPATCQPKYVPCSGGGGTPVELDLITYQTN